MNPNLKASRGSHIASGLEQKFSALWKRNAPPAEIAAFVNENYENECFKDMLMASEQFAYFNIFLDDTVSGFYDETTWMWLIGIALESGRFRQYAFSFQLAVRLLEDLRFDEALRSELFVYLSGYDKSLDTYAGRFMDSLSGKFRERCCACKVEGYQEVICSISLWHTKGASWATIEEQLAGAIKADKIASGEIFRHLSRKKMNTLFSLALFLGSEKIVCHWLRAFPEKQLGYSYGEILLLSCSQVKRRAAIRIVEALECCSPGVVKNTVDAFGNNAFWYTLYYPSNICYMSSSHGKNARCSNDNSLEDVPDELITTLKAFGADPFQQNHHHLSFHHVDLTLRKRR